AESAPRCLGDDRASARLVGVALAIAFAAGQVDVEHVDLVVARDNAALRIDQEGAVGEPLLAPGLLKVGAGLAGRVHTERTDKDPGPRLACQVAPTTEKRIVGLAPCLVAASLAALDEIADLRRHDEIGARIARLPDQPRDLAQIGLRI